MHLCSHSVAVAEKEGILPALIAGVKSAGRSTLTYPTKAGGAGRKGGVARRWRQYVPKPGGSEQAAVAGAPFTEIWHNNEPFYVIRTDDIPKEKNKCPSCHKEFARACWQCHLMILHFDIRKDGNT